MKYQAILRAVQMMPWAIIPEKLAEIVEFLELKAEGIEFTREEIEARTNRNQRTFGMRGNAAVIPVSGTILNRGSMISNASGLTTVSGIRRSLRSALKDEEVKSVILDIDSPGGSVEGIPEITSEIRASTMKKRIVAQVDALAGSAAYWIAAAADEINVTPSGELGSIGVLAIHRDISELQKKAGVKTTVIKAGKNKAEANPFEPLSKSGREQIQKAVDEYNEMFVEGVATARGVTTDIVNKKFGQGRLFRAKEAVQLGMADRISTMDDTAVRENIQSEIGAPSADGVAARIETTREFEKFLRTMGYSREQAKRIASRGFEGGQRDVEPASGTDQREANRDPSSLVLERVAAHLGESPVLKLFEKHFITTE